MTPDRPIVAVTGANGFLGSNLAFRLLEAGHDLRLITRQTSSASARARIAQADIVFHLAGANRTDDEEEFFRANRDYTALVSKAAKDGGKKPLVVYSSSAKAPDGTAYGNSKLAGETVLIELSAQGSATISIWRLPNLFGKWSRPNYNSVVATFCHNAARGLPLRIDDPDAPLSLLYVDDLIDQWIGLITDPPSQTGFFQPTKVHQTSVGEVARIIADFAECRARGEVRHVGSGLSRSLYACLIASLPTDRASYPLGSRTDPRGRFVEVLKTPSSGQFSYFTAHPGVTRGGHYHHSKVEKFLVAHGTARFRFRHIRTGESFELTGSATEPVTIESMPGWAHDVTNVGDEELIVLTWANDQFDPEWPDTYALPL